MSAIIYKAWPTGCPWPLRPNYFPLPVLLSVSSPTNALTTANDTLILGIPCLK